MQQEDSESNLYKLRNAYDDDLMIIPEMVDSALAHFFMKQLWKPMSLEIRIVPEIQNRRNMTLIIGDKESMHIEENKYLQPCVCKRQLEKEIQKLRLHLAFNEIRKRWHQVYSGDINTKSLYKQDLYMSRTGSSTSTAKPIATAVRRSASFNWQSYVYSGDINTKSLYKQDLYMSRTGSSTSTAKPIATAVRRSASFNWQSYVGAIPSGHSTLHRSCSF